jgi:hypothetical protein
MYLKIPNIRIYNSLINSSHVFALKSLANNNFLKFSEKLRFYIFTSAKRSQFRCEFRCEFAE